MRVGVCATAALLALASGFASSTALAQSCPPEPGQPPPPGGCPKEPTAPSEHLPLPEPGPTAGGLTAPPPLPEESAEVPRSETEEALAQAEEKDSGRGLSWFWLEAEGGFQHLGLETFAAEPSPQQGTVSAGLINSTASGGYVGAGLGARLLFFTFGPRARIGIFPDYQLFTVGGEVGLRIPIGIVEPAFSIGGGYATLGSLSGAFDGASDAMRVRGGYGRVAGGVDFFVTEILAIGGGASWEFLGLVRPGVDLASLTEQDRQSLSEQQQTALAARGSGFGSSLSITARLGLHF